MSHELKLYFDWFTVNKLSLNVAKTNFIVFNKDALNMGHEFKISIDGNCLHYNVWIMSNFWGFILILSFHGMSMCATSRPRSPELSVF